MKFRRKFISVLLLVAIFSSLEAVEIPSGGLDANGAAAILGETVGFARNKALKDIEPQIKFGLSGEEFSKILGKGLKSRPEMINTLSKHARKDLGADEVATILGETVGFARNRALRSLVPQIKFGLSGDEFLKISSNKPKFRTDMIKRLAGHAKKGLDANEVTTILADTVGSTRYLALKALEPNIKYDLTGEEFSKILGKSPEYRSEMIRILFKHAGKTNNQLTKDNNQVSQKYPISGIVTQNFDEPWIKNSDKTHTGVDI